MRFYCLSCFSYSFKVTYFRAIVNYFGLIAAINFEVRSCFSPRDAEAVMLS